jgi:hypothetical protein
MTLARIYVQHRLDRITTKPDEMTNGVNQQGRRHSVGLKMKGREGKTPILRSDRLFVILEARNARGRVVGNHLKTISSATRVQIVPRQGVNRDRASAL